MRNIVTCEERSSGVQEFRNTHTDIDILPVITLQSFSENKSFLKKLTLLIFF